MELLTYYVGAIPFASILRILATFILSPSQPLRKIDAMYRILDNRNVEPDGYNFNINSLHISFILQFRHL